MRSIRCPRLQDQPRPRSKPSYRRRAAAALGEPFQPARGTASISSTGALVTATVSVPSPLGMMRSTAVFPAEMRAEKQ